MSKKICPACHAANPETATLCATCQYPLGGKHATTASVGKTTLSRFNILDQQPGDVIAGRYRIVRQLGAGGMGAVFLVEDMELNDEQCALKLILPELVRNPEARERFKSEVTTSRRLQHEGIIRVFDLGRSEQDLYYFSMEYLKGESLAALLEQRKGKTPPFSMEETRRIITGILDALAYAHTKTIHRDIKPDNIILKGEYPDITIKILDFGIARTMSNSRFTQTAQGLGTPHYMAPEQTKDAHRVDNRADLYGVGMILYELLTGERAIGRFQLPSEVLGKKFTPLDDIIITALAPSPDKRYADAKAMLQAVDKAFDHLEQPESSKKEKKNIRPDSPVEFVSGQAGEKSKTETQTRGEEIPGSGSKTGFMLISAVLVAILVLGGGLFFSLHKGGAENGHLSVRTSPADAGVSLENGPSYHDGMDLPPGNYVVIAEKEGYQSIRRDITVTGGQEVNLNLTLQRLLLPGRLTVTTVPGDAGVTIVGGPEYYPGMELEPGDYTLLVEQDGYKNARRTVTMRAGENLRLNITLDREIVPGYLTVSTVPADAKVTLVNGPQYYPGMELEPGEYTVQVERKGYEIQRITITVRSGEEHTPKVRLPKWVDYRVGWLTVNPTPSSARIRILRIRPKYAPGIALKPGSYEIEVSASGYKTKKIWCDIKANQPEFLQVDLHPNRVQKRPDSNNPPWPKPPGAIIDVLPGEVQRFFK